MVRAALKRFEDNLPHSVLARDAKWKGQSDQGHSVKVKSLGLFSLSTCS